MTPTAIAPAVITPAAITPAAIAESAEETANVERIRIKGAVGIHVAVRVSRIAGGIVRRCRYHGIAPCRHALQKAGVRAGEPGSRAAGRARGRARRAGLRRSTVSGLRHGVLLADLAVLL